MPSIASRMNADLSGYSQIDAPVESPSPNPTHMEIGVTTRLISPSGGNRVPMRGLMPVEASSDTDLMHFLPYSAYHDKTWAYTYYALANQRS